MTISQELLESSLPESFPFYHLGTIEANQRADEHSDLSDLQIIAYALKGDVDAVFLVGIEKGLDSSVYSEAGNILASRLVTALAREASLDVVLSPPQILSGDLYSKLDARWETLLERDYLHLHEKNSVQVRCRLVGAKND
jgi:hypothetical protein